MKLLYSVVRYIIIVFMLAVISCEKDTTDMGDGPPARIVFQITTKGMSGLPKLNGAQIDSITLTSVKVVIDEIEFESSDEDSHSFELEEPFIQELNVNGIIHEVQNVAVPFGVYEEMEIAVDQLKEGDGLVYTNNPELQNVSVRVEGYLDGNETEEFIFTSSMELEQEFEFDPPLILDENNPSTVITLIIDLSTWFVEDNSSYLDPRIPQNKPMIEENIKNSFEVFEDEEDDD
ncbi:MAG: hypothetical protein JSW33_09745 [bacterium]|nr:MAG: hypothetical protein JSW33_09745 [bacterium]